jgi:hypothetical protein
MPTVDIGQVAASAWEALITDKPTDNIFTSQGLIYLLNESGFKESVSGGRLFEATVEYATNTTFRGYGEMEQLDTTRIDVFDAARFDQKIYAGTIQFSDLELIRNQVANRKFDLLEAKLSNGRNSALEGMNTMLYLDGSGNGGNDMDGLAKIISSTPTTGTVGGINRATFTFWRNRQNSGAKTTSAYDNLRSSMTTTFNQCSLGGVDSIPTGAVTDRATFEGYESLRVALEKIERSSKATGGDIAFLNRAIEFKGIPLIYDENCPSATLYFVNNRFLKLCYLKGGWMKMDGPISPNNQLVQTYKIKTFGNLTTSASRHLGVVTAIT